ncbi:MAG: DUF2812 domain-containing protein [Clostridiales bacterium]|nr:DUF2812 domain-containing protein [Clostridiales bacterium]
MSERKKIARWFWVWEFEKEELWLNSMALEGWTLDRVGFCKYEFIRTEGGAYTVRLEMREKDADYTAFIEETGAEYIGRVAQWAYYRKKTELGSFDLFSDLDSRIAHLDRIGKALTVVAAANIVIGLANSFNYVNIGWINLLVASLPAYCVGRIHSKKEVLERERAVRE